MEKPATMMPKDILPKFLLVLCYFMVTGCQGLNQERVQKYRETKMLMGTFVNIDVCGTLHDKLRVETSYQAVWERLGAISWKMNVFDDRSDVAKLNHSNQVPVSVGKDTYYVLENSMRFSRLTGGVFDISVYPLIGLWRESEKQNQFPSEEQIQKVRMMVGSQNIQLLGNDQVRIGRAGTKIDLGGIAKGYAVDEAARIFREHGVYDFFIDAGGDVYAGGNNCLGKLWRVGIRDPRDKSKILDVVEVMNQAVMTSGNYEQYYTIGGKRWSHIINPNTGRPQKEVTSSTVITPTAMEGDALATGLCVLGGQAGTEFMDARGENYASLVLIKSGDGELRRFSSRTYKKLVVQF